MNVFAIKTVDRYAGYSLCIVLSLFKRDRDLTHPRKILFIQLWGIGETILTLPAMQAVRKKYPKASISVLTTRRNRAVYEGLRYVDRILELEISPAHVFRFALEYFNEFDVAIDMEEYLNTSAILCFVVGKYRVGYANQIRSKLYDKIVVYNDRQHVVFTFLDLAKQLGAKVKIDRLQKLPTDKSTREAVDRLLNLYKISKGDSLICLGTGAAESSQCRKWPKERFAQLADMLVDDYKAKIILLGADYEANEIDGIINLMKNKAINLAGKTSLKQLFALMERTHLFIGNDSGPMHVAAAQGVKTVGLFGPNLPVRFGPFGKQNTTIYRGDNCEFSPCINVHLGQVPDCFYPRHSPDYQKCMMNISVDNVMQAVKKVLGK